VSKVIAISGSLRKESFNTKLLNIAKKMSGDEIDIVTLHGIPVYDGDLEDATGVPSIVKDIQEKITLADGVIISTPEYNNGIPGVL
jgi:NAD(P)H-dependent FMN reductase